MSGISRQLNKGEARMHRTNVPDPSMRSLAMRFGIVNILSISFAMRTAIAQIRKAPRLRATRPVAEVSLEMLPVAAA